MSSDLLRGIAAKTRPANGVETLDGPNDRSCGRAVGMSRTRVVRNARFLRPGYATSSSRWQSLCHRAEDFARVERTQRFAIELRVNAIAETNQRAGFARTASDDANHHGRYWNLVRVLECGPADFDVV